MSEQLCGRSDKRRKREKREKREKRKRGFSLSDDTQKSESALVDIVKTALSPCLHDDLIELVCESVMLPYEYTWGESSNETTISNDPALGFDTLAIASPSFPVNTLIDASLRNHHPYVASWIIRGTVSETGRIWMGIADSKATQHSREFKHSHSLTVGMHRTKHGSKLDIYPWCTSGGGFVVDYEEFLKYGVRFCVDVFENQVLWFSVGTKICSIKFDATVQSKLSSWSSFAPFVGLTHNSKATITTIM